MFSLKCQNTGEESLENKSCKEKLYRDGVEELKQLQEKRPHIDKLLKLLKNLIMTLKSMARR